MKRDGNRREEEIALAGLFTLLCMAGQRLSALSLRMQDFKVRGLDSPGQEILSRDENFGPPFYRTALLSDTL